MRTDRELLQECVNQLKHIDEIYGFEPLATTTSLIREGQQALNMPVVSNNEVAVCRYCKQPVSVNGNCINIECINWLNKG